MRPDIDENALKLLLEAARDELRGLSAATRDDRAAVELDQSKVGRLSRMDALQGQAMARETERRRGLELARIDAALRRMSEGEYGCCIRCGDDIEPARLQIDPAAPTCVACAR